MTHGTCRECGSAFRLGVRGRKRAYCSSGCWARAYRRGERIIYERPPRPSPRCCVECGAEFQPRDERGRYCSRRCRDRRPRPGRRSRPYRQTCKLCGSEFVALARAYCTEECKQASRPQPAIGCCPVPWGECGFCGLSFVARHGRRYCSRRCGDYATPGRRAMVCPIEYGDCRVCRTLFVRRAGQAGRCCSVQCQRRLRRQEERAARRGLRFAPYSLRQVAERDGWRCHICRRRVPDRPYMARPLDATVDHLIPVSAGGADVLENVALAHNRCNWQRSNVGPAQLLLVA